jgi:hypothetical protein
LAALIKKMKKRSAREVLIEYNNHNIEHFYNNMTDLKNKMHILGKSYDDAEIQHKMGANYMMKGDMKVAFEWFLKAAKQDYFYSQREVAVFFQCSNCEGIEKNLSKSWEWHKKAARSKITVDKTGPYFMPPTYNPMWDFYNFDRHDRCRTILLYFIFITKPFLPKDIYLLISHKIWLTRNDESWK